MATRSRASAKAAGTRFESMVVGYLRELLQDDRIERRAKTGAKDRGDVSGLRWWGHRVVAECKDVRSMSLGAWLNEAHAEAGNDDALFGVVIHKRRGSNMPGEQFVTMDLATFALLLGHTPVSADREGV
jgi:hypothetical protein